MRFTDAQGNVIFNVYEPQCIRLQGFKWFCKASKLATKIYRSVVVPTRIPNVAIAKQHALLARKVLYSEGVLTARNKVYASVVCMKTTISEVSGKSIDRLSESMPHIGAESK